MGRWVATMMGVMRRPVSPPAGGAMGRRGEGEGGVGVMMMGGMRVGALHDAMGGAAAAEGAAHQPIPMAPVREGEGEGSRAACSLTTPAIIVSSMPPTD